MELIEKLKRARNSELSLTALITLLVLYRDESSDMTTIADETGVSTAAVTSMIDRLEKLGLAARFTVTGDRRKVYVQLTKSGIELVKELLGLPESEQATA